MSNPCSRRSTRARRGAARTHETRRPDALQSAACPSRSTALTDTRYVVGWTLAAREDADIAEHMLEQAMTVHGTPNSVHADRGTSMTSKPVAQLLVDLGVARSHSRPHLSNDNPAAK